MAGNSAATGFQLTAPFEVCRRALVVLLLAASVTCAPRAAFGCTTILIGRSLTADGSVIHAHNEDMGNDAAGRLWAVARMRHGDGTLLSVPYVEIPQAPTTLGYWAAGNVQGAAGLGTSGRPLPYDSVLVGLNERGLSMSCNWAHSREESREGVGIRRYAIRQLLLERATSARHGVDTLASLIETYGQADWGGLIYHFADSSEAWVVETTTRNWVARRVRDGEIRVTANRFRIGSDYDLSSKTLVSDAVERGWLESADKELNFSRVYGRPGKMDDVYDTRREERVIELLEGRTGEIDPGDLFKILRDRYQSTDFFTQPQPGPVWREDLAGRPEISRTISTNLAQSSFVAHLRGALPASVGAVMWFGFGTPDYAGYVPLYASGGTLPEEFSQAAPGGLGGSAWARFRSLQRSVDRRYEEAYPAVRIAWDRQLAEASRAAREAESSAVAMLERGETAAATELLSAHTFERGQKALTQVQRLLSSLGGSNAETAGAASPR